jgi:hypothetical protein
MSDLDRLLGQVEELKRLATRPDDTWMDSMSTEELRALGKRVRKVADGLSGLQSQLQRQVPSSSPVRPAVSRRVGSSGSLGDMVRRDQAPPAPRREPEGVDLSNPIRRRRPNL